jgi:hypothetical protein
MNEALIPKSSRANPDALGEIPIAPVRVELEYLTHDFQRSNQEIVTGEI